MIYYIIYIVGFIASYIVLRKKARAAAKEFALKHFPIEEDELNVNLQLAIRDAVAVGVTCGYKFALKFKENDGKQSK